MVSSGTILKELHQARFVSDNAAITSIASGAINRSYQLVDGNMRYFVKTFALNEVVNKNRSQLYDMQTSIASLGMTPTPVYLSDNQTFQVDEWCDVITLKHASINRTAWMQCLLSSMLRTHALEMTIPPLLLVDNWRHYLRFLTPESQRALQTSFDYHAALVDSHWARLPLVVCHNDLADFHVSTTGLIFDWEYAGIGAPMYDIASCFDINGFSDNEKNWFLKGYAKERGMEPAILEQESHVFSELVQFTNQLWYAATQARQHDMGTKTEP
ncbi:phosphotransferase [Aestuariibacter sp. AA17]|uniref:Phosphotransferase n=1 Tax=Fluctibacter corallii TaxID=2984329 RepID=A0ABT3ABN9_9ALTE|nr:phosphotransferase [Aestuariibacter sp. AA17]MCV2886084.1 phosphotransferase [Aestuariibacter sp. AA17]